MNSLFNDLKNRNQERKKINLKYNNYVQRLQSGEDERIYNSYNPSRLPTPLKLVPKEEKRNLHKTMTRKATEATCTSKSSFNFSSSKKLN